MRRVGGGEAPGPTHHAMQTFGLVERMHLDDDKRCFSNV
jgi:hypothetical protein